MMSVAHTSFFTCSEPERPGPDPEAKDIPMITSMLEELEKEVAEEKNGGMEEKKEKQDLEKMEKVELSEKKSNADETTQL